VAPGEDEWRAEDWWPSEPPDRGVTPPRAVPAWMDPDFGRSLGSRSATADDTEADDTEAEDTEADETEADETEADDGFDEALVTSCVELAMQNLQRHRVRTAEPDEEDPLRCFGSDDATLYALEDGPKRLMIGRGVGRDDQGCVYCLVGTSSPELLAMLDSGEVAATEAFDDAVELTLCTVFQADEAPGRAFRLAALNRPVSNVVLVERYKRIEDVPAEYRPGQPFLQFTEG